MLRVNTFAWRVEGGLFGVCNFEVMEMFGLPIGDAPRLRFNCAQLHESLTVSGCSFCSSNIYGR
jgi:hypothetical protein